MTLRPIIIALCFACLSLAAQAKERNHVCDLAGYMPNDVAQHLESELRNYADNTGINIVTVCIMPKTDWGKGTATIVRN